MTSVFGIFVEEGEGRRKEWEEGEEGGGVRRVELGRVCIFCFCFIIYAMGNRVKQKTI